ncbi:AAA family ATPase [Psychroflexus aestuariivivens]|uniref:AAA family ATPase n=1 Tax=Psychroflexus aestuariivivens TaxID=1795040 RepID=UPI000FDACC1C|nr:ATP-binding protein [Psychroflexus aestuariivivens]
MEKALVQTKTKLTKIVLFGPESSGKTSLAKALAESYNTEWVPEFAREYLQKKYDDSAEICEEEDLIPIAIGQMKWENEKSKTAKNLLFCDTNLLQTYVYATVYFEDFKNETLKEYAFKHDYDFYFLTYIDTPWEEDDLRDKPNERIEMFEIFKHFLKANNLPFAVISGSLEQRILKAQSIIENL